MTTTPRPDARRLHQGRWAALEEGAYVGGPVPFGLHLDAWGRWERSDDEAWVLRELAARRALGATFKALAAGLNNRRRPIYQPSPAGKRWTPAIVHRLLANPIYRRTADDVPEHLVGLRRIRAEYNYATTGILAEPPTPDELRDNEPFVAH